MLLAFLIPSCILLRAQPQSSAQLFKKGIQKGSIKLELKGSFSMRKNAKSLAGLFALTLVSSTSIADIIPSTKIDAIKTCIAQKMSSTSLPWRTHTYYLSADAHYASHEYISFDTCRAIGGDHDGDDLQNGDGNHGPVPGDVVEGQVLQNNGTYKPLPDCTRFKFAGPETFYNDGIETHNLDGGISADGKTLSCNIYTAGSSSVGGGGAHIWAICYARLVPIYSGADKAYFLKLCAREVL